MPVVAEDPIDPDYSIILSTHYSATNISRVQVTLVTHSIKHKLNTTGDSDHEIHAYKKKKTKPKPNLQQWLRSWHSRRRATERGRLSCVEPGSC